MENEPYTIVDWLRLTGYDKTIENAPYEIVDEDLEEIQNGEYLITKDSIIRIVKAVSKSKRLGARTRKREIVDQRNYLYSILRLRAQLSLSAIGLLFNKDHTTVLYALRKLEYLRLDKDFKKNTKCLNEFFNNPIYINI